MSSVVATLFLPFLLCPFFVFSLQFLISVIPSSLSYRIPLTAKLTNIPLLPANRDFLWFSINVFWLSKGKIPLRWQGCDINTESTETQQHCWTFVVFSGHAVLLFVARVPGPEVGKAVVWPQADPSAAFPVLPVRARDRPESVSSCQRPPLVCWLHLRPGVRLVTRHALRVLPSGF